MPKKSIQPPAIVKGKALYLALGFGSARSFQRARAAGQISVRLYPVPGQARGVYALRRDVIAFQEARTAPESTPPLKHLSSDQEGAP